jgi:hypothetical protein
VAFIGLLGNKSVFYLDVIKVEIELDYVSWFALSYPSGSGSGIFQGTCRSKNPYNFWHNFEICPWPRIPSTYTTEASNSEKVLVFFICVNVDLESASWRITFVTTVTLNEVHGEKLGDSQLPHIRVLRSARPNSRNVRESSENISIAESPVYNTHYRECSAIARGLLLELLATKTNSS